MSRHLYELIEAMRQRPEMYIGRTSLTGLQDHLGGFQVAMHVFEKNTIEALFPLPFCFFSHYVANHYHDHGSVAGWHRMILEETQYNEEAGFFTFYELFDRFKNLSASSRFIAPLAAENKHFHQISGTTPKRYKPDSEKYEPIYDDPTEIHWIELTHQAGYLLILKADSQHWLKYEIYKTKRDAETWIQQCFGSIPHWKTYPMGNLMCSNLFKIL